MEYVVLKGHFKGKNKDYFPGEVLTELEPYKSRLDYFVSIGMLEAQPVIIDVESSAPKKAKKKKAAKKEAIDEIM